MAKIFVTGSSDGLGLLAGKELIKQGHEVVLHARSEERKKQLLEKVPDAKNILIADLASQEETKTLASEVNALGKFDAVIHNAGVYQASGQKLLCVNVLAPYLLTCLIEKPERLIYLSSSSHLSGHAGREGNSYSYSDSKLDDLIFSKAVARKWKDVYSNALDPGWVPTKMGGSGAPDNLEKGFETQVWLSVSNDDAAKVSGRYFYHKRERSCLPIADDLEVQEQLLNKCEKLTGVKFD